MFTCGGAEEGTVAVQLDSQLATKLTNEHHQPTLGGPAVSMSKSTAVDSVTTWVLRLAL